jgi:siroheme synthase
MVGRFTGVVSSMAVCALIALAATAADVKRITADAEGHKRAADGARSIRSKSGAQLDDIRLLYTETATDHNTWIEATAAAINQGAMSEAINPAAEKAAKSFVTWVAARNASLGEPVLSGRLAESVEAQTRHGLIDIAAESIRNVRNGNAKKKSDTVNNLTARLRWKTWDEL